MGHHSKLTFKNDGHADVTEVAVCLPAAVHAAAAFLEVLVDSEALAPRRVWGDTAAAPGAPAGAVCALVELPEPLARGKKVLVEVRAVLTRVLKARPAKVPQTGAPAFVYDVDSAHTLSPYAIAKDSSELRLGGGAVLARDAPPPATLGKGRWALGPYANLAPFTTAPLSLRYENAAHFADADAVEREIDVGYFAGASYEERYSVRNAGPELEGEWSRFDDLTRAREARRGVVARLAAELPPGAEGPTFRDGIGNISTSVIVRTPAGRVGVVLEPRYPLYGGWRATFSLGWRVPRAAAVLRAPGARRARLMAAVGPAVRELVVQDLRVRVLLPPGATDVRVECEAPHERIDGRAATWLDFYGRPTVELRLRNFVPEADAQLEVSWRPSALASIQRPAAALVAVLGAAAAVVAAVRPHVGAGKAKLD